MTTNDNEEEEQMEFQEFEDWYRWRQAPIKYLEEARQIWEESITHGLQEVESRFNQFMQIQRWGGIIMNTRRNIKVHINQLRTISFVIDFKEIPKIWSKDPLPKHFHMKDSEYKLCLNYERTNRKLYKWIYNNLLRINPWIKEIVIPSIQCCYIELPLSYAVRREAIKSRSYGVRIKDDYNKYHNYLLMHLPEGLNIDGNSLAPVQRGYYSNVRFSGFHSLADTIPLQCGYERPINSYLGDHFAGPGLMKISYERKAVQPLPPQVWFHRFVDQENTVQTFKFPEIDEILFGNQPISKARFSYAMYQLIHYGVEMRQARQRYIDRMISNGYFTSEDNMPYRYRRELDDYELNKIMTNNERLFFRDWEENEDEAIQTMFAENADRFERYNNIYHKFVVPGYHYVQRLSHEDSRYIQELYDTDFYALEVQLIPYYRKVDIIHTDDGINYWESDHDPGRVFPFVSYCDKSFIYCFNSGWDHIVGYFTATVIGEQSQMPRLGDSAYNEQYRGGIIKVNVMD